VYGEGKYRCGRCGDVYPGGRSPQALADNRWEPACPSCGGPVDAVATDEDSRTNPSSVYGASKMSQELLAAAFGPAFGMHVVILRYQNVYGAGQSLKNPYTGILTHFFSALRRNGAPRVFEDGRESRDFVHVGDVVAATAAALSRPDAGVFNVGSGVRTTILQLAEAMADCLGSGVRPVVVGDYRVGDIRHCFADLRRAEASLGYTPKIGLTQGLNEFLAWAQEQPDDTRPVEEANRELLAHGLLRSGHDV
jgi:dTDP-L-rhamnose 4-epimerase